jgi:hypothetical protein
VRTAIGLVVLIALAALAVGKCTGGDQAETPQVSFTATVRAETDGKAVAPEAIEAESDAIVGLLNDWYQRAFMDPRLFGDGDFRAVSARFTEEARAQFARDIDSLTIGEARTEVASVVPGRMTVGITVFFENGAAPRFATASVRFSALATLKDREALPLQIVQNAKLHFEKSDSDWLVAYYEADETQSSLVAAPRPTGT